MQQKSQSGKEIFWGLLSLCVIIWGSFLLLSKLWSIFSTINSTLAAGMIAASATIIVSLISVLVSKHLDRKALIYNQLREKKVPTYVKIIEFIFRITFAEKLGKPSPTEREMIEFFAGITQEIVIWGSDEMLNAFYIFRMSSIDSSKEKSEANLYNTLYAVEDLLLAIRKDLGHSNHNISRGKVLGLFINDSNIGK